MKRKFTKMMVVITIMSTMLFGCAGCAGCNKNAVPVLVTPTMAVTTAPTVEPTATVAPTIAPTAEPEFTPTVVPTPTEIPATPTPIPTATPVPTKAVTEDVKPIESIKMGDNVWYDFYEDGTLIVRGTGKTRDVDASFNIGYERVEVDCSKDSEYREMFLNYMIKVRKIVIEEGITELGDWSLCDFCLTETVILPSSLKKIGYAALFSSLQDEAECIGLRHDMEIEEYALGTFYRPNDNFAPEFKEYAVAPSLKPMPTATPLPNPDKPRKAATLNIGANITYEFWDNGVMYVKGTGKIPKQSELFCITEPYWNPSGWELAKKTRTVVIEEGITGVGDYALLTMPSSEWYLPKSLVDVSETEVYGKIFHGYYEGKAVTVDVTAYGRDIAYEKIMEALENEEVASKYSAVITWE